MSGQRTVHAFADDVLGDHDATTLAGLIRGGQLDVREVIEAAIARAEQVQPVLNGVHVADYDRARRADRRVHGVFAGVPTFVKDNVDVAGLPTNHGSAAFQAHPAESDSPFVAQFKSLGFAVLGKSRLPEFGFSASTEYADGDPVRNPWHPDYSAGASSGGAAVLVASGVVPMAHANDGGGSIRIPAAACGLVGLKPTRGRLVPDHLEKTMPVNIVGQGVVTRSVRDTAGFLAGAEQHWRNPELPPVRHIDHPGAARLRVGVVLDSITGTATDAETRAAVEDTAALLADLGHHVDATIPPVPATFADDFGLYWGLLGLAVSKTGSRMFHPDFDVELTDNLTKGLAALCRRRLHKLPAALIRLRRSSRAYHRFFERYDVILSPVLGHTTPVIGHLSPALEFEEIFDRLQAYVGFTPLNNAAGGPAISLPLGQSSSGLPIGVHFSADHGDERTLLELAYELEEAHPFPRIQDA